MPRHPRHEAPGMARFLTWSCYRNMALLGSASIRDAFIDELGVARDRLHFALLAWVVMPDHVHLVIGPTPERHTMADVRRAIKTPFARRVLKRWRELDAPILRELVAPSGATRVWQRDGGYDRAVRDDDELRNTIGYVHANPVRAGLVDRPEAWAWSSAGWYAGGRDAGLTPDPIGWRWVRRACCGALGVCGELERGRRGLRCAQATPRGITPGSA